ncbi:MAG TPA: hypothetical protein DCM28_09145, partial [Phycisphaerales bacterium]|nr:hypothetical protein [Phycisphaerales bacterium]
RGYLSTSGNEGTWNAAGDAITLSDLPQTVYFGLCLTSHNSNSLCTATIDNVTLNGLTVEEEDDEQASPQLIVAYEFDEVTPPAPVKLHHWKLDETTGSASNSAIFGKGASAGSEFRIHSAYVDSYDSAQGEYNSSKGASAQVTLNGTSSNKLYLDWGSRIYGDALVGNGGSVDNVIYTPEWSTEPHISGTKTTQDANVELPTDLDIPSGLPSKGGNATYNYWQPQTISSNLNKADFRITSGATVNISGDVIIACDKFTVDGGAHLVIPSGSSLRVYARGDVNVTGGASVNAATAWSYTTTQTDRFSLYCLNQQDVVIEGNSVVVGYVYSTHDLEIKGSGKVFGAAAAANKINMSGSGYLHVDQTLAAGGGGGDGTSTNVVSDEQGVSDGIYHGGPTGPHDGPVGTAVYFDGSNDYVEIPHNDNMLLNSGTVSIWVKPTSNCGEKAFFSKDSTSYDTGGHLTMWVWDNKITVRLQSTNTSYWVESSDITTNNWYHVVFSWGDGGMKLFVNGQLEDTHEYAGGLGTNSGGNGNYEPIVLGANSWDSNNFSATPLCDYFKGYIDDVRIYDMSFEAIQASQLYNGNDPSNGSTGYLVQDTSNFGTPLNLNVQNTNNVNWISGGGLEFVNNTSAVSSAAATKLYDALTATNKMTLEVKFQTSSVDQSGPANLISYSGDSYARNFTFGQSDLKYLMRMRTSQTSNNGSDPVDSTNVLDEQVTQHVVVTYDGESIKMYRNGSTTPEITSNREGTFNWNNAYRLILGNEEGDTNPWLGKLFRFTIYDQALNTLQVKDLFDGNPPGDYDEQENLTFHVRWYENP